MLVPLGKRKNPDRYDFGPRPHPSPLSSSKFVNYREIRVFSLRLTAYSRELACMLGMYTVIMTKNT